MIRMTPKISVRPDAIRAYTPPVNTPSMAASNARPLMLGLSPHQVDSLPVRLWILRLRHGDRRRVDRHRLAVLPLDQERGAVRLTGGVEAHRALDGLEGARVQRADQLAVVDAADPSGRLLDHLADAVRLGRVGADGGGVASEPGQ